MFHNDDARDQDNDLDLSHDAELARMEREAEATREKLARQERDIELMLKDLEERNAKRARAPERERREREKAGQEATRYSASYVDSDEGSEWLEEEDDIESSPPPERIQRTLEQNGKKTLYSIGKGQSVLDKEACQRCRTRRLPCHRQEGGTIRVVCYRCAAAKEHCSWMPFEIRPRIVRPRIRKPRDSGTPQGEENSPSSSNEDVSAEAPSGLKRKRREVHDSYALQSSTEQDTDEEEDETDEESPRIEQREACKRCSSQHLSCSKQGGKSSNTRERCSWADGTRTPRRGPGAAAAEPVPRPSGQPLSMTEQIRLLNERVARLEAGLRKCGGDDMDLQSPPRPARKRPRMELWVEVPSLSRRISKR
ncbi:hypothetical protein FB45DRAFT_908441 [Roridomyces roridus]|uniref:Zn(2)-C6 fungal-type domain-containing protein n=1 Tax=Roridomyces roridus TaxID=1738132 RepID=A0AAD7C2Y4_9AGAR|nr:hypothetical protein FB45DRAFT_908441 [Roridomyces roridus]